jgi:3-oxoacyl-[acyl-carrier protein] reductase
MAPTKHVAIVTGAAGTMGRSVVEAFVEAGITVAAVDIKREGMDSLVDAGNGLVTPYVFDISDPAAVEHGTDAIRRDLGSVDILVNNAGVLSTNKLMATTPEEWNRIMAVNLNGAFYLSRAILPGMREKKWGRIVNISSWAAKCGGLTAGTAYSVSKAALIGLTFAIAAETTREGITVNGIAPAFVKTPMVTEQLSAEKRAEVEAKIPVGRFCEPEEFAHTVMFLVSEKAGFITGEIVDMNGGFQFD